MRIRTSRNLLIAAGLVQPIQVALKSHRQLLQLLITSPVVSSTERRQLDATRPALMSMDATARGGHQAAGRLLRFATALSGDSPIRDDGLLSKRVAKGRSFVSKLHSGGHAQVQSL